MEKLYGLVLIPEAVRDELIQTHPSLPSFLRCEPVRNPAEVARLSAELDQGEAEAIALAKELGADALLMDEAEGRRVARREGVPFIGLLGVLVQGKHRRHVSSVRALTAELEAVANFHLSAEVKQIAFRAAGE